MAERLREELGLQLLQKETSQRRVRSTIGGYLKLGVTIWGGLKNKDCSILGSILGSPYFVALPTHASTSNVMQPRVEALNPDPKHTNLKAQSPPQVDRIWGIWGSYYNIPKALFYKGDYKFQPKLETPSVKSLNATSHHLERLCWIFQPSETAY